MPSAFTRKDRTQVLILLACLVPFVANVFFGVEAKDPWAVVASTGLAIASAGFSLAWGTESLQFVVSQALALTVLAVVNVIPEYSVEVVLAYRGATDPTLLHYATASMTGANRLLLGLGWPVVYALNFFAARRAGEPKSLELERSQGVGVVFLGAATLYSFVIAMKGTLGPEDALVLLSIFGVYVYAGSRIPPRSRDLMDELEGPARAVSALSGPLKALAILFFVGLGAAAVAFGSEPFLVSFLALASLLNVGAGVQYLLIQWLTPILTELPEAITVFYWAAKSGKASLALSSLVSSKLNQWTILVATIPAVYDVALGGFASIHLTGLQTSEILLTAAQSLYGFACLLDLKLSRFDASALLTLFLVQFVLPEARLEVTAAYLLLSAFEFARTPGRLDLFRSLAAVMRGHLH
ncbi:MAG: sodium:calcium antiporter [Nitrososphaerota archaeon]|nr:sodium:calcium antiporter [Nitrososphaerota archaeon]